MPARPGRRPSLPGAMRRSLLAVLSAVLLLSPAFAADRPNVLLFLVDDMGWMDCGAYGSQYYETPHIDRFARRAMRFTDAYAQPLCSPTRASLLTGQYSARHGITTASGHQRPQPEGHRFLPATAPAGAPMLLPESRNYLEPAQVTLAEVLRDAGYRTAHIGKWHLGLTALHWPEQQGFDATFHCHPDPGPPGEYFSPYGVSPDGEPTARHKVGNITDGPEGEYIVDRQAAEAVKFIQASRGRPFFLNLWCYGVHGPWGHKPEDTRHFAGKTDPSGRQGNPIMASMLKSVDDCFGRILGELEAQGLSDNTIVIFASDNGGNTHSNVPGSGKTEARTKSAFLADWRRWAGDQPPTRNTPLRDGKGTLYEGGTRVPLLWAWPGRIAPGSTSDAVVGPIDVYPTLLDLLGLEPPPAQRIDGVSYARVLEGQGALERTAYFNYHPHAGAQRAGGVWVRRGDYKLLRWFGPTPSHELYHLGEDLGETKNLAAAQPERVRELDALIDAFLRDTGAAYPRPNPAYRPVAAKAAADPLAGWKVRQCEAAVTQGVLRLSGGRAPGTAFLGRGMAGLSGPAEVKLRLRRAGGGQGRIETRAAGGGEATQAAAFQWSGDDWQDVQVKLEARAPLGVLRIHLPAEAAGVEVDWIEVTPAPGEAQRWEF